MSDLTYIHGIIDNRYETYDVLKRKYGVIKEVLSFARAIVTVEDSDMMDLQKDYKKDEEEREINKKTRDLNLLNKTGEELEAGDGVWVYYWHDIVSGYIAVKCGAKPIEIAKCRFNKWAIMPAPVENDIYSHARYPRAGTSDNWELETNKRKRIIDETHGYSFLSGAEYNYQCNMFLVNGFPTASVDYIGDLLSRYGLSDYYKRKLTQQLESINPKLYTNRILLHGIVRVNPTGRQKIKVEGDLEFYLKALLTEDDDYAVALFVKCNDVEYRVTTIRATNPDAVTPTFPTEREALSTVKMVLVSNSYLVDTTNLHNELNFAIAIRYGENIFTLAGSIMESQDYAATMWATFASWDEYWYARCVIHPTDLE